MTKLTTRFNNKRVSTAKPPPSGDYILWDSEMRCFGLRVFASGKKSFLVQYRVHGQTRRYTIGDAQRFTADEARKQAQALLRSVSQGEDPAAGRDKAGKGTTVAQLCELYLGAVDNGHGLGHHGHPKKASTLRTDLSRIRGYIKPLLGHRRVEDITASDVKKFLEDVQAGSTNTTRRTGGKGAARRTVGLLGGIMAFAIDKEIVERNPVHGVRKPPGTRRNVVIPEEHYRALGHAIDEAEAAGMAWQAVMQLRLIALTGLRRGEAINLKWAEVDLSGCCLRLPNTKTGRSVRPIGTPARDLLRQIRERSSGDWVFPGKRRDTSYDGLRLLYGRIAKAGGIHGLTPHWLRHGFATTAADTCQFSETTISGLLGHAGRTITSRYAHAVDETLLRAADEVARTIHRWMNGETTGTVIELRGARRYRVERRPVVGKEGKNGRTGSPQTPR